MVRPAESRRIEKWITRLRALRGSSRVSHVIHNWAFNVKWTYTDEMLFSKSEIREQFGYGILSPSTFGRHLEAIVKIP